MLLNGDFPDFMGFLQSPNKKIDAALNQHQMVHRFFLRLIIGFIVRLRF